MIGARKDFVCIAAGVIFGKLAGELKLHKVNEDGRAACDETLKITWCSPQGDVVAAVEKARQWALCMTCWPSACEAAGIDHVSINGVCIGCGARTGIGGGG